MVLVDGAEVSEDGPARVLPRSASRRHKVPKSIAFAPELPRNAQGKLLRDRLG